MYERYRIKPKRDFSGKGYLLNGQWIRRGFVVTNGGMINVMPGATWFLTIADAMDALRILIEVNHNPELFWQRIRERKA
ncbi:hypothetical protein EVB91_185 [Rhizobium phage RHph_I1_18]|nr:hypothetical protein EVB91_185 [Rhizobium phage RHph_I1_18]